MTVNDPNTNLHLSFSGCGFQGLYHIGVASCIRKHAPYLFEGKIAGCSAGGLIAAAAICNCKMEEATQWALDMVRKARSRTFGPFHPSFDLVHLLRVGFDNFLPPDAHIICNGRLHLSLTTLPERENIVVNEFKTRVELINALICTCWIPFFAGFIPPVFEGKRYMDGGFTDNILMLDEHTITVTPFCGGGDISPIDKEHTFNYMYLAKLRMEVSAENLGRFARIFYPPNAKEVLSDLCKRGYDDAFNYLLKNKLMSCGDRRCLNSSASLFNVKKYRRMSRGSNLSGLIGSMHELNTGGAFPLPIVEERENIYRSSMSVNAHSSGSKPPLSEHENFENCENCPECIRVRARHNSVLPDTITSVLQNFNMHESLYNYICSYKVVQLVGLLTLPVRLPMEAVFHNTKKLFKWLPFLSDDFGWLAVLLGSAVQELLKKTGNDLYIARFQCEFEFVDVDETPSLTRPVSYCSLHSAVNSRRSSFCVENISVSRRGSIVGVSSKENKDNRFSIDVTIGCESRGMGLNQAQYSDLAHLDYQNSNPDYSDDEDGIIFFASGENNTTSSHDHHHAHDHESHDYESDHYESLDADTHEDFDQSGVTLDATENGLDNAANYEEHAGKTTLSENSHDFPRICVTASSAEEISRETVSSES